MRDILMARALLASKTGDKEAMKQVQAEADALADEAWAELVKAQQNEARVKAEGQAIMAEAEAAKVRLDALLGLGPDAYRDAAEIQKRRAALQVVTDEEE